MKKKFSIVLATILVVCTLAIALVACAPKDPDPFKAESKGQAYDEIWNAWLKTSDYKNGDTLGIDLKVDAKNSSSTDLSVILQAGLKGKTGGGDGEGFRLAVIDNKKKGDLIDLVINKDGLFVDSMGLEKPLKFYELSLPALGVGPNGANDQIANLQNYFSIVMGMLGTDVTIDPVLGDKKTKMYDVEYKFGLDFTQLIAILENPSDILSLINAPDLAPIVEIVAPMLKDALTGLNVEFSVKTTGNTQTKVEKPAKNSPKYKYAGGKVTGISAVGSKGSDKLNLAINGLKLLDKVPNMAVPNDENCVEMSLLKHHVTGEFNLKDSNGEVFSTYNYVLHTEFSAQTLISAISDSIATGNTNALMEAIFSEDEGNKLFFDVTHYCTEKCATGVHMKDNVKGSILSVAFSPSEFNNSRIYASLDIKAIFSKNFIVDIVGGLGTVVLGKFKDYDYQFSFDIEQYIELVDMRANGVKPSSAGTQTISDNSNIIGINSIISLISDVVGEDNKILEINYSEEMIENLILGLGLDEGTAWTIIKAVKSLLYTQSGISQMSLTADYINGTNEEYKTINVRDLYVIKDAETNDKKNFASDNDGNNKVITGQAKYTQKDGNDLVNIYQNGSTNLDNTLFDSNGNQLNVSYEEFMALADPKGNGGMVQFKFNDLLTGNEVTSFGNIIEIVGLDKNNTSTVQNVALVLSSSKKVNGYKGGIGSNLNNLIADFAGLSGMVPQLAFLKDLTTPELVVKTQVKLSAIKEVIWSQENVAGINESQIIDIDKTYNFGDVIATKNNLSYKYSDDTVKSIVDVEASNKSTYVNSNGTIKAKGTFTLKYSAKGYDSEITVKMNDADFIDKQTIDVVLSEDKVSYALGKSSLKHNIPTAGVSTKFNETDNEESINEFNKTYGALATATANNGIAFVFNKVGEYNINIRCEDRGQIELTFDVKEGVVENFYTGKNVTYANKFGEFGFAKDDVVVAGTKFNETYGVNANASVNEDGSITFIFKTAGSYDFNFVDTNNVNVRIRFIIKDAKQTISKINLNEELEISLAEQFNGIEFLDADVYKAVTELQNANVGKLNINYAEGKLQVTLFETGGTNGFTLNIVGKDKEIVTLKLTGTITIITKEGVVNTQLIVTAKEIGVPYTRAEVQADVDKWNNSTTNAAKMTIELGEGETPDLIFTLKKVGYETVNRFTLTNKFRIGIAITEAPAEE